MKARLEFDLPEEEIQFMRASRADIAWDKLYNIDVALRSWIKHGHDFKSVEDLAQHIRTQINEALGVIDE